MSASARRVTAALDVAEIAYTDAERAVTQFLQLLNLIEQGQVPSPDECATLRAQLETQLDALRAGREKIRSAR